MAEGIENLGPTQTGQDLELYDTHAREVVPARQGFQPEVDQKDLLQDRTRGVDPSIFGAPTHRTRAAGRAARAGFDSRFGLNKPREVGPGGLNDAQKAELRRKLIASGGGN